MFGLPFPDVYTYIRFFRSSNQVLVTCIGLSLDVLHIDGEAKTDTTV